MNGMNIYKRRLRELCFVVQSCRSATLVTGSVVYNRWAWYQVFHCVLDRHHNDRLFVKTERQDQYLNNMESIGEEGRNIQDSSPVSSNHSTINYQIFQDHIQGDPWELTKTIHLLLRLKSNL